MTWESRQVTERIDRPADEVYACAADPARITEWAPGLGTAVVQVDGDWYVETTNGRVGVTFTPRNEFGILDHEVTLPTGEVLYNPLRVTRNDRGSEIVFSLRRMPGVTDEEFERDAAAVAADLARLKQIVEAR